MGYDPSGTWDWEWFGKVAISALVVGVCLTGVGMVAAAAATAASISVSVAVTTAVVSAGISTTIGAIDGAICAEQSGGDWRNGALAGAMGGSAGALVSKLTGPSPHSDTTLRLNVAGRAASSAIYDISYELFENETIDSSALALAGVDVVMDVTVGTMIYDYTSGISNTYIQAGVNAITDGVYDIFQTIAYFAP